MKHNLLSDSLIGVSGRSGQRQTCSLPGLFAGMARREVAGFAALRPHQRPAWHMFLVQLAAVTLWKAGKDRLPDDSGTWAALLRAWTLDYPRDEPWCLIVEKAERPAFLQPPDPGCLKWRPVLTPDNLDMINMSKNFDVKRNVAYTNQAEDWLYALVSLQTMAGYAGQRTHGIVRMSSGFSSRTLLGLAPGSARDRTVCPSAWWARDVRRLLQGKRKSGVGKLGGPALVWCLPWQEGEKLRIRDLDPWFIEVCRRVRLARAGSRITARRSTSGKPRIDRGSFKGNVGDPWMPVERKTKGKSLTVGWRGFSYFGLTDLLFSGKWKRPLLAEYGAKENGSMVLVAEAFGRGKRKSEGFHARRVPVPGRTVFESESTPECARQQISEIQSFAEILRNALVVVPAGGDWRRIVSSHYQLTQSVCEQFYGRADRVFFEALWKRVAAHHNGDVASVRAVRRSFLEDLHEAARAELDLGLSSMPCPSAQRSCAQVRALRWFSSGVRRHFPELSQRQGPRRMRIEPNAAAAAAAFVQNLGANELEELRRMPLGSGTVAFRRLAARHPDTIGRPDQEAEWRAILQALAILMPRGDPTDRPPLHDPQRRLGTVLCDGGDLDWPESTGGWVRPAFSELQLTQMLAARGEQRASKLKWAARALRQRMRPGSGVDVRDIAALLLAPHDSARFAEPYYLCLDRARARYASEHFTGAAS